MLAQQIVSGLAAGSLYALMAMGLVLIYKVSDVVNFGHGAMAAVGTFVAWTLLVKNKVPVVPSMLIAIVVAALLGIVVERLILRPARNRHATVLGLVMATLGVSMILSTGSGMIFGWDTKNFPYAIGGKPLLVGPLNVLGATIPRVVISRDKLLAFAVAALLALALAAFFKYAKWGIAMRAVAQNHVAARLMGISTNRIYAITWGISSGLALVAGALIAPSLSLDTNTMTGVLLKAFAGAVLGGFTSLPGALVGGLMLGVMENLVAAYVSTDLKSTFAFLIIILILAVRPAGLLGRVTQKKV
jgi:branched-chain amino acid transport system permease protein